MIIKPIGSVELPRKPRRGMDALAFSESVYRSIQQLRDRVFVVHSQKTRNQSPICPFGEIIPYDDLDFTKALRGGVVYCGDKNFIVPIQGLNLEAEGEWLVYLQFQCEANRDDDGEIFLPGIKTSAETLPFDFWQRTAYTYGDNYPDNTQPSIDDGIGIIVIPIGKLTITGGNATLEPVACGNVTVNQCAGILSHTRA